MPVSSAATPDQVRAATGRGISTATLERAQAARARRGVAKDKTKKSSLFLRDVRRSTTPGAPVVWPRGRQDNPAKVAMPGEEMVEWNNYCLRLEDEVVADEDEDDDDADLCPLPEEDAKKQNVDARGRVIVPPRADGPRPIDTRGSAPYNPALHNPYLQGLSVEVDVAGTAEAATVPFEEHVSDFAPKGRLGSRAPLVPNPYKDPAATMRAVEDASTGRFMNKRWAVEDVRGKGKAMPGEKLVATDRFSKPVAGHSTPAEKAALNRTKVRTATTPRGQEKEIQERRAATEMVDLVRRPQSAADLAALPTEIVGQKSRTARSLREEAKQKVLVSFLNSAMHNEITVEDRRVRADLDLREEAAARGEEYTPTIGGTAVSDFSVFTTTVRAEDRPDTAATAQLAPDEQSLRNTHTIVMDVSEINAASTAVYGPFRACVQGSACEFLAAMVEVNKGGWTLERNAGTQSRDDALPDGMEVPRPVPGCELLPPARREEILRAWVKDGSVPSYEEDGTPGFCLRCVITYTSALVDANSLRVQTRPPTRTFNPFAVLAGFVGQMKYDWVIPATTLAAYGHYGHALYDTPTMWVPGYTRKLLPPTKAGALPALFATAMASAVFCFRVRDACVITTPSEAVPRGDNQFHFEGAATMNAHSVTRVVPSLPPVVSGVEVTLPEVSVLAAAIVRAGKVDELTPVFEWACLSLEEQSHQITLHLRDCVQAGAPVARELLEDVLALVDIDRGPREPGAMPLVYLRPTARQGGQAGAKPGETAPLPTAAYAPVTGLPVKIAAFFGTFGYGRQINCGWTVVRLAMVVARMRDADSHWDLATNTGLQEMVTLIACGISSAILEYMTTFADMPQDEERRALYDLQVIKRRELQLCIEVVHAMEYDLSLPVFAHLPPHKVEYVPQRFVSMIKVDRYPVRVAPVMSACAEYIVKSGVASAEEAAFFVRRFDHCVRDALVPRVFDMVVACVTRVGGWRPSFGGEAPWHATDVAGKATGVDLATLVLCGRVRLCDAALRGSSDDPGRLATVRFRDSHLGTIVHMEEIALIRYERDVDREERRAEAVLEGRPEPLGSIPVPVDAITQRCCLGQTVVDSHVSPYFPHAWMATWCGDLPICVSAIRACSLIGKDGYQIPGFNATRGTRLQTKKRATSRNKLSTTVDGKAVGESDDGGSLFNTAVAVDAVQKFLNRDNNKSKKQLAAELNTDVPIPGEHSKISYMRSKVGVAMCTEMNGVWEKNATAPKKRAPKAKAKAEVPPPPTLTGDGGAFDLLFNGFDMETAGKDATFAPVAGTLPSAPPTTATLPPAPAPFTPMSPDPVAPAPFRAPDPSRSNLKHAMDDATYVRSIQAAVESRKRGEAADAATADRLRTTEKIASPPQPVENVKIEQGARTRSYLGKFAGTDVNHDARTSPNAFLVFGGLSGSGIPQEKSTQPTTVLQSVEALKSCRWSLALITRVFAELIPRPSNADPVGCTRWHMFLSVLARSVALSPTTEAYVATAIMSTLCGLYTWSTRSPPVDVALNLYAAMSTGDRKGWTQTFVADYPAVATICVRQAFVYALEQTPTTLRELTRAEPAIERFVNNVKDWGRAVTQVVQTSGGGPYMAHLEMYMQKTMYSKGRMFPPIRTLGTSFWEAAMYILSKATARRVTVLRTPEESRLKQYPRAVDMGEYVKSAAWKDTYCVSTMMAPGEPFHPDIALFLCNDTVYGEGGARAVRDALAVVRDSCNLRVAVGKGIHAISSLPTDLFVRAAGIIECYVRQGSVCNVSASHATMFTEQVIATRSAYGPRPKRAAKLPIDRPAGVIPSVVGKERVEPAVNPSMEAFLCTSCCNKIRGFLAPTPGAGREGRRHGHNGVTLHADGGGAIVCNAGDTGNRRSAPLAMWSQEDTAITGDGRGSKGVRFGCAHGCVNSCPVIGYFLLLASTMETKHTAGAGVSVLVQTLCCTQMADMRYLVFTRFGFKCVCCARPYVLRGHSKARTAELARDDGVGRRGACVMCKAVTHDLTPVVVIDDLGAFPPMRERTAGLCRMCNNRQTSCTRKLDTGHVAMGQGVTAGAGSQASISNTLTSCEFLLNAVKPQRKPRRTQEQVAKDKAAKKAMREEAARELMATKAAMAAGLLALTDGAVAME